MTFDKITKVIHNDPPIKQLGTYLNPWPLRIKDIERFYGRLNHISSKQEY